VLNGQANAIALFDNAKEVDLPEAGVSFVPYASFACVALRASAYKKTEGFDSEFSPAYSEDVDLSIELLKCGYLSTVAYQSRVFHLQGQSSVHLPELAAIKERNREYLLKKQKEYFYSISLIDDPRHYPHQLKRALTSNMQTRKLLICSEPTMLQEFYKLVGIDKNEISFSYISLMSIDSESGGLLELEAEFCRALQNLGVDCYFPSKLSLGSWFRDRICLYDEVVCLPNNLELINQNLFVLIKSTQPQALFRLFDS